MIVARELGARRLSAGSVLTIGAFDGLHLGHQALLTKLCEEAKTRALDACVLSFEPLPREYFGAVDFLRLTSLREKLTQLRMWPIDCCVLARFNHAMMQTSPEAFVEALVQSLQPKEIWVGADFRFGHRRAGTVDTLSQLGHLHGFDTQVFPLVHVHAERVSASRIRSAILNGQMRDATHMLGRPFAYTGRVIHGQQLARTLGFPTANIGWLNAPPALYGVYAVRATGAGLSAAPAVASLGVRPVVAGTACWLEVHLFDFAGDLYGQRLRVELIDKLRPERNFSDLAALTAQVELDIQAARERLA